MKFMCLIFLIVSCTKTIDIKKTESIGNLNHIINYQNIFLTGQPDEATLKILHDRGFKAVINLQAPSETKIPERELTKKLNMSYHNTPLLKLGEIDEMSVRKISKLIGEEKTLIHCANGQRAGAWLVSHLVNQKKADAKKVWEKLDQFGVTSPKIKFKLKSFLKI